MSFAQQQCRLWVVIPVKDFVNAKQRLSGVLSPSERRALSQAMVEDMLRCLQALPQLSGVLLVSDDPGAELLAYRYGASLITEARSQRGLNAAAAQGAAWLAQAGASHMLLLHGDLPCVRAEDIARVAAGLANGAAPLVRLVPDRRGEGTNGLLCSLPAPIMFDYGAHSLRAHRHACHRGSIPVEVMPAPGLALDMDTPADLYVLSSTPGVGAKTARFLDDSQVVARLRHMLRADDLGSLPDAVPSGVLSGAGNKHAH